MKRQMSGVRRTVAGLVIVALLPITVAGRQEGGSPFHLVLSGANEFNAAGAPINPHGDADRGTMTLSINPGREEVCWSVGEIELTAGEALPHVAHIHSAPEGLAGPVVIDIFGGSAPVPAPTEYPTGRHCVAASRDLLVDILSDPDAYYINLHNAQHPGGVMRAQLSR